MAHVRCLAAGIVTALVVSATEAQAQYDLEEESPFALRALLDVRLVRQGPQPSWLEGGPGKTRYGGVRDGGDVDPIVRFALSQLALEPSVSLPWGMRAQAQLNWDVDIDVDGHFGAHDEGPRLIEAFVRQQWGSSEEGWALQAGVSNPPFSLENSGPAWTPKATLTSSAASSWLWEEGRPVGIDGEWWGTTAGGTRLGGFAGIGWGPDQLGILLAQRGWVLSDYLSGVNSALPIPATGRETKVFDERDGRPALYAGASAADASGLVELRLGYFDNLGDLGTAGVWETRFGVAGVVVEPVTGLEILMQGLIGNTATRSGPFESRFSAWYPLVSYRYRGHRVSARYDNFSVCDEDGGASTAESGYAVTFAYLFEFWLRHRVGFEVIYVDSERPAGAPSHQSQSGFQLSYRFRY